MIAFYFTQLMKLLQNTTYLKIIPKVNLPLFKALKSATLMVLSAKFLYREYLKKYHIKLVYYLFHKFDISCRSPIKKIK